MKLKTHIFSPACDITLNENSSRSGLEASDHRVGTSNDLNYASPIRTSTCTREADSDTVRLSRIDAYLVIASNLLSATTHGQILRAQEQVLLDDSFPWINLYEKSRT